MATAKPRLTKGERTRRRIVERAAVLFNTRGVAGASMADVSDAAGLEKGGVYNHFESKDALALAAFDYAAELVLARTEAAVATHDRGWDRLLAILDVYRDVVRRPALEGGCPLLNTAVEADDTNPVLRGRLRTAFDRWGDCVKAAVERAVAEGDLRHADPGALATMTIASIEGGVMLARVYRDASHIERVATELTRYLASYRVRRPAA